MDTEVAKILFLNFPAHGHVNPTLAIASELATYDVEVTYALPESFREAVELAGATMAPLPAHEIGMPPALLDHELAALPFEMARKAPQMVPPIVELIGQIKPDLLVYNSLYLWGRLAASCADLRAASFRPFHAPRAPRSVEPPFPSPDMEKLAITAGQALDMVCRAYGQPATTLQELVSAVESLTLMFTVREFQHGADAFDDRFLFTGPCLPAGRPGKNFFSEEPVNLTKRVYISLGTLRNDDVEFYRLCFDAFQSLDWQPVMSVGRKVDPDALWPAPPRFHVAAHVPQLSVLAEADVFITHGGFNSVMEAMYYGVPVVVMPATREQRLTARRVRDLGLGVMIEREGLTAEDLRQVARHAANEPGIRSQVRWMQQTIRESGGVDLAARALIRFMEDGV